MVIATALAYTRSGSAIRLVMTNDLRTCAEIRDGELPLVGGETLVGLDLANIVSRADPGKRTWEIRETRFSNSHSAFGEHGSVEVLHADTTLGALSRIRLDARIVYEMSGEKKREAVLEGELKPLGCGDLPPSKAAPRPQADLVLEVAGRRHVVMGAVLDDRLGQPYLSLSAAACGCTDHGERGDAFVGITFKPMLAGVGEVYLGGDAYFNARAEVDAAHPFSAKLVAEGAGEAQLALDGTMEMNGYRLSLKGTVRALDCR